LRESNNLASRRLASSAIPNARPYTDTSAEQGDYFLMSKNSIKLTDDPGYSWNVDVP